MDYTNHLEFGNSGSMPTGTPMAYFSNGQLPPNGLAGVDPIEFMKTYVFCCKEMFQLGVKAGEYYALKAISNQQDQSENPEDK